jgi:hypothetical protein
VHRRRLSQTPFAAPCRTFSHTHTRVGCMLWDFKRISLSKILVFFLFFLFKIISLRLGYESVTLLMVMMADSSRGISCSMHQADASLPCTAGWPAAAIITLPYPILSCPLTGTAFLHIYPGQVMLGLPHTCCIQCM